MIDASAPSIPPAADRGFAVEGHSGSVAWHLELSRRILIPGRLVDGRVRLVAEQHVAARALVVQLVGVEHWRHRETRPTAQGQTTTEVVRTEAAPINEPVVLAAPVSLAPGEPLDQTFQLPVPPIGPASLDAEDAGMTWTLKAKLDIEGGLDSEIEAPVVVAQPTALLRAGAVRVAEYALYDEADASAGDGTASIRLTPMPLVCGEPFSGTVQMTVGDLPRLQEVRAELRIVVEATVSQGEREEVTAWSGLLAPVGEIGGARSFAISGLLPDRPLPSIELPHGRTSATFHVILALAWQPDVHFVRDVAIATTREV